MVSGKVPNVDQFVMGGFEIAEKISAIEAYDRFPEQRLRQREDGQLTGNVIVNADGKQHELDHHDKFDRRIENYIVGTNPIVLSTPAEIAEGGGGRWRSCRMSSRRRGTASARSSGRCRNLTEKQIEKLRAHLEAVKKAARQPRPVELHAQGERGGRPQ